MHHQEHTATARIWSPAEREMVSLCMLASVENNWLPVERTAIVCDISKICPSAENLYLPEQGSTTNHVLRKEVQQRDQKETGACDSFAGFRIRRFPAPVSCSIREESNKDNVAPLKSSHLSSQISFSKGWKEMKMASAVHPGSIQQDYSHRESSLEPALSCTVLQTANPSQSTGMSPIPSDLPLVDAKGSPNVGFSSITFSARMVPHTTNTSPLECSPAEPRFPTLTHGGHLAQDKDSAATAQGYSMVDCDSKPLLGKRKPVSVKMTDHRQSCFLGQDVCETRAPEIRQSSTDGENKENAFSDFWQQDSSDFYESSAQCSHCTCSRLEVSVSAVNSVLYLNRALTVLLGKGTMEPSKADAYRSTLSLRLQSTALHRQALNPPGRGNELERPRRPSGYPGVRGSLEFKLCSTSPASTQPSSRLKDSANNMTSDLNMCCLTSEVSLSESRHLSAEVLSQDRAGNKKTCQCRNSGGGTGDASDAQVVNAGNSGRTSQGQRRVVKGSYTAWSVDHISETPGSLAVKSSWKLVPQKTAMSGLTLREALQLFRPDFITHSQDRLLALERRALERRSAVSPGQEMGGPQGHRRRKYTKPHPLSDNLFKPKERIISGKEMQSRSKRIYNKLPEVMKKKEEEKKKIMSQTNRLRVELFKKKLLEQVLQRTHD
ncbi:uncharacterized protein LOC125738900 isoform X2 [Brienomyrus brachyistius]|uniref:uncharacterized protein LOC125738900 isoform X2 n=1 Tax=Brienomyrus brachyistius TaxID=42636 RepID=UPI0020B33DBD|nr:uncharacterized protein LOC125738900 isoform X2 [Brienomyrus brachyistius]